MTWRAGDGTETIIKLTSLAVNSNSITNCDSWPRFAHKEEKLTLQCLCCEFLQLHVSQCFTVFPNGLHTLSESMAYFLRSLNTNTKSHLTKVHKTPRLKQSYVLSKRNFILKWHTLTIKWIDISEIQWNTDAENTTKIILVCIFSITLSTTLYIHTVACCNL